MGDFFLPLFAYIYLVVHPKSVRSTRRLNDFSSSSLNIHTFVCPGLVISEKDFQQSFQPSVPCTRETLPER